MTIYDNNPGTMLDPELQVMKELHATFGKVILYDLAKRREVQGAGNTYYMLDYLRASLADNTFNTSFGNYLKYIGPQKAEDLEIISRFILAAVIKNGLPAAKKLLGLIKKAVIEYDKSRPKGKGKGKTGGNISYDSDVEIYRPYKTYADDDSVFGRNDDSMFSRDDEFKQTSYKLSNGKQDNSDYDSENLLDEILN